MAFGLHHKINRKALNISKKKVERPLLSMKKFEGSE